MSYDQYGCNTKAQNIIKEMINKYFVKTQDKRFPFDKNFFLFKIRAEDESNTPC